MEAFLEVSLVLLTSRSAMFLKTFEKTQATSLPWFSTQQQTSTVNRQKSDFFYANFSIKLNEISFFFEKHHEAIQKWLKLK